MQQSFKLSGNLGVLKKFVHKVPLINYPRKRVISGLVKSFDNECTKRKVMRTEDCWLEAQASFEPEGLVVTVSAHVEKVGQCEAAYSKAA